MKHVLTIISLLFPLTALSQENTHHLSDVQVLANRKLKDVGIEKTTLDTLILHDNISLSMGDILSKHTTLFIKSYGRATEATAEFRGTSPSHTQVLWNGMRINSPMLGTVDFSTIPAYFVDEANLYHGASSINLTGGGLGGAVELITAPHPPKGEAIRTGDISSDSTPRSGIAGLQYVQGFGSFDTFDQFLRLTYRKKGWSASTRMVYSTSKNEYKYTNYDKKTDVYDDAGNIIDSYHPVERNKGGYFDDVHALQELYYDAGDGNKFALNLWYNYSKRGLPFLSVDYKEDSSFKNEHKQHNLRSVLSWDHTCDAWKLSVKGGYAYGGVNYHYYTTRDGQQNNITMSESRTNTGFLKADADWYLSEKWLLQVGATAYYNHVNSSDMSPFHVGDNFNLGRVDADVNVQVRWRPFSIFSLAGVVREELHGSKIAHAIPALFTDVILYRPMNLVLKASVARNYRYPSMDDLYFQPGGNPDLKPEKGLTYDVGLEIKKGWGASLTFFDSYISDWILWTPNLKGYWEPSNVKKVHNYGIEASANADVSFTKDLRLSLSANFAWTPSRNVGERVNSNDESYGKQLCYVPLRSANLNARLLWKTWTLAYQWNHYSERFTTTSNEVNHITGSLKPYYMSDLSLEKTFRWSKAEASIKGVVNNLLGTEYVTVLSHPMPGRNYEVYVTIKL